MDSKNMQIKDTNSNTTENPNAPENNGQAESGKLPYSYHTFVYPFEFDGNLLKTENKQKKTESRKMDADLLMPEGSDSDFPWEKETNIDDEVNVDRYNIYNYFTAKARNIIFNTELGSATSLHYKYKHSGLEYIISYEEETDGNTHSGEFKLNINGIKLSLFPRVNIGIITLETEYDDDIASEENVDGEESNIISVERFERFERVCKINEFGRRLFYPSIYYSSNNGAGDKELHSWISATKLSIRPGETTTGIEEISAVYSELAGACLEKPETEKPETEKTEYTFLIFLQDLLGKSVMKKLQGIKPIIDERMFVNCIVRDDKIGKILQQYDAERKEYDIFQADKSFMAKDRRKDEEGILKDKSSLLYAFVFIDSSPDKCRCQNKTMRTELLKQHVYGRWIGSGTLYGITEYSFVSITGEGDSLINKVINPFLTQYTKMAIVALVQRAALNRIEEDIVDVCESKYTKIDIDTDKITKVWEKFVIFQNLLFLPEVTFQEQGVELYAYLKKSLKLDTLNAQIEDELNNLHEYAELMENKGEKERDDIMNRAINSLAFLAVFSAITDGTSWAHGMLGILFSEGGLWAALAGHQWYSKVADLLINFLLLKLIARVGVNFLRALDIIIKGKTKKRRSD